MCGNFMTKEKPQDKYLGDMLAGSLSLSVLATIKDRESKVRGAMLEAKLLVEDFRSESIGGLLTGLELWEAAIKQTLLYNCSTWVEMDKDAEDKLEELQLHYLRLLLAVPSSCPKVALRLHTGTLSMKYRIWIEKVMLVLHIRKLPQASLANQVYREQLSNKWPGLAKEASVICDALEVESVHDTDMTKNGFKKILKESCLERDEKEMREKMASMSKCEAIRRDEFKIQEYMKSNSL